MVSPNITVVGAGVQGLTVGLLLQKQGYEVTIIAKYLPGDLSIEYTSPWAGNISTSFLVQMVRPNGVP
jgi:D-amino-acid oxidase